MSLHEEDAKISKEVAARLIATHMASASPPREDTRRASWAPTWAVLVVFLASVILMKVL